MKPPAYVSIVLPPTIRIESLDEVSRGAIERKGSKLHLAGFNRWFVSYQEAPGELIENESFIDAFRRLNEAGIAFGEDHKQGWAPADIMRELQSRNRILEPFTAIAWRSPDDWFTTTTEPNLACS
jgi:hypothetical protein